ncbi:MAG: hypothetical protein AAFW87_07760 [Pseudomonadota bacterium]
MAYVTDMQRIAIITCVVLALAAPATSQDDEEDSGTSLMERGAQLFLEGIMREMEPALDDLQGLAENMQPALRQFVDEMGPAFADLLGQIDDLSNYHAPEMLPNGDIIIRRKTPLDDNIDPDQEIEI